jgi:GDP/UDP-N,N'-diacetylbacillosamine 2-epimerase (hydrolysing)
MKVMGITGIRSEYDILQPVLAEIARRAGFQVSVTVMGAHLSKTFGETVQEIRKDGFQIADEIESLLDSDRKSARIKGLGMEVLGLTQTVTREQPDLLLIVGDREESIVTALVGAYLDIPVAHIAGGDRVVGNVDDQVRHAVSKLATIHFTTNEESAQRLIKMGEQPFRVFNVGTPGIDRLMSTPTLSRDALGQQLGIDLAGEKPYIVVLQHVISSEADEAYTQMTQTLQAVKAFGHPAVVIYPNSDSGGREIIRCIEDEAPEGYFVTAQNLPRLEFVNLLKGASCLLGNSSLGIMEAPALSLPVINVGNRQKGRLHGNNVQFIPHQSDKIVSALQKAVYDLSYRQSVQEGEKPYGSGDSASRIADALESIDFDHQWMIKDITY